MKVHVPSDILRLWSIVYIIVKYVNEQVRAKEWRTHAGYFS
jgi:hypothetical protein